MIILPLYFLNKIFLFQFVATVRVYRSANPVLRSANPTSMKYHQEFLVRGDTPVLAYSHHPLLKNVHSN